MVNVEQPADQPHADADPADPAEAEVSAAVVALTDEDLDRPGRARQLGRLVRAQLREGRVRQMWRPGVAVRWVLDAVVDVAPRIPVRDLETLRRHHDGLEIGRAHV